MILFMFIINYKNFNIWVNAVKTFISQFVKHSKIKERILHKY